MKTSPTNPKFATSNYCGYEFDPQADFTRFLEEAKKHACEENFEDVSQHIEGKGSTQLNGAKKNRNSWKNLLFSWLKSDKKTKTAVEPLHGTTTVPKLRRGIVSGPMHGNGNAVEMTSRPRKPTSGHLTSLFSPAEREEDGNIPYMCLNQRNNSHHSHSFGPVYLVT